MSSDDPKVGHAVEQLCVSGEIDRARPPMHDVAQRLGAQATGPGRRRAIVASLDRCHGERTDARRLAHAQLGHFREPPALEPRSSTGRHQQARVETQQPQRGQVEVVVMQVRDQHRIEARVNGRIDGRNLTAQMRNAIAQQRVGEQAYPVQLDQDGGMTQENDTVRRVGPTGESRAIGHK